MFLSLENSTDKECQATNDINYEQGLAISMKMIEFSVQDFKEWLERDPRVSDEYIEKIELPQAFSSGSRFLKKYVMQKSGFEAESNIPSDWFRFSMLIKEIEVDEKKLKLVFDEKGETHPPFMSRT